MLREEVTTQYKDAVWPLLHNQCNDVPSATLYSYHLIKYYATPFEILYPSLCKEILCFLISCKNKLFDCSLNSV